jgi:tRNA-splicing endonuclease subunit Sen34
MAPTPVLPIPISFIYGRYLLFSADAATYLRREHHVGGVLIGTLPQVPQQNVFLGLPLELMPEEARLLVEKGVAFIVDEKNLHDHGMRTLIEADKREYLQELENEGLRAAKAQVQKKERQREEVLKKLALQKKSKAPSTQSDDASEDRATVEEDGASDLFRSDDRPGSSLSLSRVSTATVSAMGITPATSYPLLPYKPSSDFIIPELPKVPASYPVFAHLHSEGYFLSPGLRFGCQYVAYPGDSLRFHSHFLVVAADWDEELRMMEIVGGGRLGTGVKKGFLLGGAEPTESEETAKVRTFSIEWAGM